MKTKVEAQKDNKVTLTVTIDAKEVDEKVRRTYKDFAYKYSFPGFRKGKAPRQVIDTTLGSDAVLVTVTDDIVNEAYPEAIDRNDLFPISRPEFDDQNGMITPGKPFNFKVSIQVKPEFELSSYDPIEIEMPAEEATEEEINQQIDALRDYYFTLEDAAASTKVAADSYVDIAIKATDDKGNEIVELNSDSRSMGLGLDVFPEAFDKELIGLKKGDEKSFEVSTEGEDNKSLTLSAPDAKSLHFDVKVQAVKKKVLPELTDEWAEEMGFESADALRDGIKDSIDQQKKEALARLKEDKIMFELGDRLEGEVPEAMVEEAESRLQSTFFQQLQAQNMTFDAYLSQSGITSDIFKEDVKRQATDTTKQDLALDAWARNAKIKATDKDITKEFEQSGAENPKELEAQWRANGQLYIVKEGIVRTKATQDIMDGTIIKPLKEEKQADKGAKADAKKDTTKKATSKKATEKTPAKKTAAKKATDKK